MNNLRREYLGFPLRSNVIGPRVMLLLYYGGAETQGQP